MTIDEFFERLPRDGWTMDDRGCIRRNADHGLDCPVTCVAGGMDPDNWDDAANFIGLDDSEKVILAADNESCADHKLRSRLLAHCGLKEDSE